MLPIFTKDLVGKPAHKRGTEEAKALVNVARMDVSGKRAVTGKHPHIG